MALLQVGKIYVVDFRGTASPESSSFLKLKDIHKKLPQKTS
jgi:hypothetical protein